MWFKNLMVFTIDPEYELDLKTLNKQLQDKPFNPCGPQEMSSIGWVSPLDIDPDQLVHEGVNYLLLKTRKEDRLLPATVIRDEVGERVEKIEIEQDRKVTRKERMDMRDDVTFELTPKAFRRSGFTQGLILPDSKLIVIDAGSWKKAEEWLSLLRETLGSLPVRPAECQKSASVVMTTWLHGKGTVPNNITFGDECELQSTQENGAIMRCRRQDLDGEEIRIHLDAGKQVTKMAVDWYDSLSFLLTDSLEIKRFRFSDGIMQQAKDDAVADEAAEKDAMATLMAMELERFLPSLWSLFGDLVEA